MAKGSKFLLTVAQYLLQSLFPINIVYNYGYMNRFFVELHRTVCFLSSLYIQYTTCIP
jgi:hypothetical protein